MNYKHLHFFLVRFFVLTVLLKHVGVSLQNNVLGIRHMMLVSINKAC